MNAEVIEGEVVSGGASLLEEALPDLSSQLKSTQRALSDARTLNKSLQEQNEELKKQVAQFEDRLATTNKIHNDLRNVQVQAFQDTISRLFKEAAASREEK